MMNQFNMPNRTRYGSVKAQIEVLILNLDEVYFDKFYNKVTNSSYNLAIHLECHPNGHWLVNENGLTRAELDHYAVLSRQAYQEALPEILGTLEQLDPRLRCFWMENQSTIIDDWNSFTLKFKEKLIERVPELLALNLDEMKAHITDKLLAKRAQNTQEYALLHPASRMNASEPKVQAKP